MRYLITARLYRNDKFGTHINIITLTGIHPIDWWRSNGWEAKHGDDWDVCLILNVVESLVEESDPNRLSREHKKHTEVTATEEWMLSAGFEASTYRAHHGLVYWKGDGSHDLFYSGDEMYLITADSMVSVWGLGRVITRGDVERLIEL